MGWLKNFLRKHIVGDLPEEMDRFGYCNSPQCSEAHFHACPNRLKSVQAAADEPSDR